MNAGVMRRLWQMSRIKCMGQRLNFSAFVGTENYATQKRRNFADSGNREVEISFANVGLLSKPSLSALNSNGSRRFIAETAPKERRPNVEMLLERLNSGWKLNGYLNFEQISQCLDLLEQQTTTNDFNQLLSQEQSLFLLDACATQMPAQRPAERMQLFQRLWQYLQQHNQLTQRHYLVKMKALQHNRIPLEDGGRAILEEMSKLDATAARSVDLYAELLQVVCASGDISAATEVLSKMRALDFPLTERNFNSLLLGHGRNRDLRGCQTVLDSMMAAGVPVSNETQSLLIEAYLENGETAKALELLKKFHRQFNGNQVVRMLRSSLYTESVDEVVLELLVRELPPEFTEGPEVPLQLRNLCIELLHNSKLPLVLSIVSNLPTPSLNENQDIDKFGVFLLHELFRTDTEIAKIIEIASMLKSKGKNTRALHVATEIALRRSPPLALPFFEVLAQEEPLRPHYFWPLFMYNHRRHGEVGVLRTLRCMSDLKVACDQETLTKFVLPHLWVTLERPNEALKALDAVGVRPSQILVHLLVHLLTQQKMDEALELVEAYPTKLDLSVLVPSLSSVAVHARATKRYQQFAKILAALQKKADNRKVDFLGQLLVTTLTTQPRLRKDLGAMQRFTSEMRKFGLTLSPQSIDVVQSLLSQSNEVGAEGKATWEKVVKNLKEMSDRTLVSTAVAAESSGVGSVTSSFIKHPRDMTLDELECHLIELESKHLNTRGVVRRLLQLCVREGRLKRALELKEKCDALKVQVSPGMFASIFDMYIKLKDLPKAELAMKRLLATYPGFKIDEHKIIDFTALLVHENQLERAKKLLEERAATQKINGGNYVIKNVWNFLTNVAHLAAGDPNLPKERNLTRETFHFLQKLRYCNAHNAILGPIVREYLLRGDIRAAVVEFRKLAEQYKHTPLQFELLSLLVRLSNARTEDVERYHIDQEEAQRLLGEVGEIVAKVHGILNRNSALLLAFAESGTDNQLRRMLINPEYRINQELLVKNCEHLGQEGSVTTLLRLARGARGLNRIIDEQAIYNLLLQNFAQSNNYEAALDLFERLEADDELKVSQEFLKKLVQLLKVNNIEIPSNVALRAQVI